MVHCHDTPVVTDLGRFRERTGYGTGENGEFYTPFAERWSPLARGPIPPEPAERRWMR